ncbi:uncharacterized protein LOC124172709 [Ischnura elegans]|uniref:uncharacterized protein LOC124172709 n=1 Tax=Ischnura elegans TaxID=197161 RepID=UPI001ED8AEB6|nr:uncharacterized protein LOC124172709 [Ischnura elegans]
MLAPHLYLLDMLTDIHTAYLHFSHNNYLYFGLTVLFVCGPMMAEIISYVIVSLLGGEFRNSFRKGLLNFESLKLLPKSIWSLCYAMNSRSQFGDDLDRFYSELHRLRCVRFEGQPRRRRYKAPLIQAQSCAMMVMNEKLLYKWNMNEALNESAPQLLLQMIIINILIANGEVDGYGTLFGMVVSLTTFAWSLHLYHHKMHYVGLENNFKIKDRLFDFLAHFFIVFGRFVAISCVAALYPMRFLGIAGFYLGLRFIYLYYMSSDKVIYRDLTESYPLWPVHRLFITPYVLNIWRVDFYDDAIYHFETLIIALSWPFLLDGGHPLADYRWIITAIILAFNFVFLRMVLKYNASRHNPTKECPDGPPFPSSISLGKKLEAGKSVWERLGEMYAGN